MKIPPTATHPTLAEGRYISRPLVLPSTTPPPPAPTTHPPPRGPQFHSCSRPGPQRSADLTTPPPPLLPPLPLLPPPPPLPHDSPPSEGPAVPQLQQARAAAVVRLDRAPPVAVAVAVRGQVLVGGRGVGGVGQRHRTPGERPHRTTHVERRRSTLCEQQRRRGGDSDGREGGVALHSSSNPTVDGP